MSTRNSTVCVIGAGPAGLCAVKHCLDFGLSVHCYELRARPGGHWAGLEAAGDVLEASGPRSHRVAPQLLLASQFVASFSDFPLPDDLTPSLFDRGRFLHAGAFREYLERYANAFSLRPHIVCRMEVVRVERLPEEDPDGFRWTVTVRTASAGERSSRHRFVVVATGPTGKPRLPEIAGSEACGCAVLHSSQLRCREVHWSGRAVLVVGGGCSSVAAVESALLGGARKVTWVASRAAAQWPSIWLIDRYPGNGQLAWDEWPLRLLRLLPRRLFTRLLAVAAVPAFQRDPNVLRPLDLDCDRLLVANVDVITAGLASDRLTIRDAALHEFGAPGSKEALLTDGSCAAADLCVLATGCALHWPFLSEAPAALYRGVLPFAPSAWGLAFLHSAPSAAGAALPLAELEARWVARHWACGRFAAEADRVDLERRHRDVAPESPACDPLRRKLREATRLEQLATDIACDPPLWRLLLSPRPARRHTGLAVLAGPWLPQQFRLDDAVAARTTVRVAKDVGGWRFLALLDCYEVVFHAAGILLLFWISRRFLRR